jgi:hypothetical protein
MRLSVSALAARDVLRPAPKKGPACVGEGMRAGVSRGEKREESDDDDDDDDDDDESVKFNR